MFNFRQLFAYMCKAASAGFHAGPGDGIELVSTVVVLGAVCMHPSCPPGRSPFDPLIGGQVGADLE